MSYEQEKVNKIKELDQLYVRWLETKNEEDWKAYYEARQILRSDQLLAIVGVRRRVEE